MMTKSVVVPESEETDVVVLGAGAGGMAAACVASVQGLETLLLEKTRYVGGTTAISGGMVWAPNCDFDQACGDSRAKSESYLLATVPTDRGRDLRDAFLDAAPAAIAYLERHTAVQLKPVPVYPTIIRTLRALPPAVACSSRSRSMAVNSAPPLRRFGRPCRNLRCSAV